MGSFVAVETFCLFGFWNNSFYPRGSNFRGRFPERSAKYPVQPSTRSSLVSDLSEYLTHSEWNYNKTRRRCNSPLVIIIIPTLRLNNSNIQLNSANYITINI